MRLRQRTLLVTAACALFLVWEIFYECRTCHVTKGGDKAPHQRFLDSTRQNVPRRSSLTMGVHTEDAAAVLDKPTGASAYEIDSFLEGPLPVAFKEVLQKYPVVPSEDVKIVLIVAYYRSGSSFFGELMSSTPLTFFHYEPLMLFTVSGGIRPGRQYHAFQLLNALVRCRFEPLYTAWMETTPHYKHNHFLTDVCEGGESCFSPGHLAALCSRAKIQVFKFTRLRVRQVQTWMQQNPGIAHSARVVHLVRDPRGIYFSRRGLRWCTDYKHCDSPAMLCDQMRSDLDAFGELSRQMPNDRIYQIRFEDISVDPLNETKRLFTRLGLDFAPSVSRYIENHTTRVALEMKNAHSTRRDPREVAEQWKRKLTIKKIRQIEAACSEVLQRLGYKRF